MVDQQGAGGGLVVRRHEGALEGLQQPGDVLVEVADLPGDGPDYLGLIGRQVRQVLGSLGMLDLRNVNIAYRDVGDLPYAVVLSYELVPQIAIHGERGGSIDGSHEDTTRGLGLMKDNERQASNSDPATWVQDLVLYCDIF